MRELSIPPPVRILLSAATALTLTWPAATDAQAAERQLTPLAAVGISVGSFVLPIAAGGTLIEEADRVGGNREKVLGFLGGASFGYGLLVGPSTAHLYLGEYKHVFLLSGILLFSAAVFSYGSILVIADCPFEEEGSCGNAGGLLILAGFVGYSSALFYDFVDSARAAKRHAKYSVIPIISRHDRAGMRLCIRW